MFTILDMKTQKDLSLLLLGRGEIAMSQEIKMTKGKSQSAKENEKGISPQEKNNKTKKKD